MNEATFYRATGKRIFDILLASFVLLALSPLLLLISVLIKATSSGPVFFKQERVGKDGSPFRVYKFRTMVDNAEKQGAGILCLKDDPRITWIGKYLRATSLDEIPQIINVFRGEMSLIGPRPGLAYQVAKYSTFQRRRLEVFPGITGWAQVNGRNSIPWDRRIELDVEYVENLSFSLDLEILIRTVRTVIFREGQIAQKDHFKEKDSRA